MASRICLERLSKYEAGYNYAKEAMEAAMEAQDVINAARGYLCMVICGGKRVQRCPILFLHSGHVSLSILIF